MAKIIEKSNYKIELRDKEKYGFDVIRIFLIFICIIFSGYVMHSSESIFGIIFATIMFILILFYITLVINKLSKDASRYKTFSYLQAVQIIGGFYKGFVGHVTDKGFFHPDGDIHRLWGYRVRVNCNDGFHDWSDKKNVVACLCKKCESRLFKDGNADVFYCKKCGKKVKIINNNNKK